MNIRTLNRKLGKDMVATREGRDTIRIESRAGLSYRIEGKGFGDAAETAEYLRSKVPTSKLVAS